MAAPSDLCLTPQCVTAATNILQNLHPAHEKVDPCNDFDRYACGGFPERFAAEKDVSVVARMGKVNQHILQRILEGDGPPTSTGNDDNNTIFQLLADNYNSCMNATSINSSGLDQISEIVSQVMTLFPMGDVGYESNVTMTEDEYEDLAAVTAYLAGIGVPVFGDFWILQDMENPDTMVPWYSLGMMYRGDMALPATSPLVFKLYENTNETIPDSLLAIMPTEEGKNAVPQLYEGLLRLIGAMVEIEDTMPQDAFGAVQDSWTMRTVAEVAREAPALGIDKVIDHLTPAEYQPDRMVLSYKEIYPRVSDIISRSPKAVIQALLILRVFENYAPFISAPDTLNRFEDVCFSYIDQSLPWIASKFYLDQVYSEEAHNTAQTIGNNVKNAFIQRIEKSEWLDTESRKLVADKARKLQLNLAYPEQNPNVRNATALRSHFEGISITSSWISNALSIRQWGARKAWHETLLLPVNRLQWAEMGVHSYNAGARAGREKNMIMIPAGMASMPFFDPGLPASVQYARMGYLIGHEIVHNFDDVGMLLSNERTTGAWLTEEGSSAFTGRADCIREQYSEVLAITGDGRPIRNPVTNETMMVNGNQTLSENIADQGGLRIAFEAWEAMAQAGGDEPNLPGLDAFTKEQLFFLAFGQSWCTNYGEQKTMAQLAGDAHSPGFARTRVTALNTRAFRKAWQCEEREPMCEVW